MKRLSSQEFAATTIGFDTVRNQFTCPDPNGGNWDFLFPTKIQAQEFHAMELRRLQDREAREARQEQERQAAEQARAAYLASFRGFLPADPMRAGRILQTLERKQIWRGRIVTRKETIEALVNEGRTLTENGLENATGGFARLIKTERDYAAHLIALGLAGR